MAIKVTLDHRSRSVNMAAPGLGSHLPREAAQAYPDQQDQTGGQAVEQETGSGRCLQCLGYW
ncbi:hypothetical protein OG604_11770 [Streptomyces sp. NBC_01231]|nr:hypothetical protein OG604_11770 [Streptomyces sp. NBC_01231]